MGNAIEQANLWYRNIKEQFGFCLYTDVTLSSQQMRVIVQLCAVTQITKEGLGINHQVHRVAAHVEGNVRRKLNCGKEVYRMKSTDMEFRLTRVVSSSGQT